MKNDVCAIIVTYNTSEGFVYRLQSLYQQVKKIIIVDNGSNWKTHEVLKEIEKKFSAVEFIKNAENIGLASALNQGIRKTLEYKCEWILMLDDDSEAKPKMVAKMLEAYDSFSEEKKKIIAMVAPNYINLKGPVFPQGPPFEGRGTITSGALIKKDAFQEVGFFRDDFFVYCIDTEFCLRLKKYHLKIILVPNAFLKHHMGGEKPEIRVVFGKKTVVPNNSPWRYYYVFRNSCYIYADYWKDFKSLLLCMFGNLRVIARILLFEKDRVEKIKMILKGVLDALRKKTGKVQL